MNNKNNKNNNNENNNKNNNNNNKNNSNNNRVEIYNDGTNTREYTWNPPNFFLAQTTMVHSGL